MNNNNNKIKPIEPIPMDTPQDHLLWQVWKKNPSKDNLSPLLDHYDPLISKRVTQFNLAEVPQPAMKVMAKRLAVEAFQTYNPSKEASLNTHVYTHLKRLSRYVQKNQNIAKIPENRILKIREFKITKGELEEQLGREPSIQEMSESLRWPLAETERMEAELRGTVLSSAFEGDLPFDTKQTTHESRVIRNIYYELSPEEQLVYEYLLGFGGKPKLNESQIAKKLNMSITKVSRIKHGIGQKIEKWL